MPNRIIKESICCSETLAALDDGAQVLFHRLTVQADDFGRFDGRPEVIRSRCYQLGERTTEQVAGWLDAICATDALRRYVVNGRPYVYFVNWRDHQQVRNKASKYPDPPAGDGACMQLPASPSKPQQAPAKVPVSGNVSESGNGNGSESETPAARAAAPAKKAPREKAPPDPRVSPLMRHFDAAFRAKTGKPYAFRGAAEATAIRRLPEDYDLPTLTACVDRYFKNADEFTRDAGYSFGLFVSRIPALLPQRTGRTTAGLREFPKDDTSGAVPCPPQVRAALAAAVNRDKAITTDVQTTRNLPANPGSGATNDPAPVSQVGAPGDRGCTGL
jgi:hypothetical protein